MEYHNPSYKEIKEMIATGQKPIMFYHISKEEILDKNLRGIDNLMSTVQLVGKGAKNSLFLTCSGYDDVTDELYEIKEVREFVSAMFDKYPHILYYINSQFEGDHWLLCSIADELEAVTFGEKYTGNQLFEKFGLDNTNVPRVHANITFKNKKFPNLLKSVIKHGKKNKDVRGAKRIAIEYAFRFDNTETTLAELNITKDEVRDLMG